ncbi:MAG: crossover junction endodeoxyribonuclease RuvC [Candidatus Dormibacteraeota bacterium]|nr:crossover junction endodeoxyribonuclease RuvC [Candidatus Dormibacteraeota bacterium]
MTRVLGVDPGLGRTGVAVVDGGPGDLRLVHAERLDTVPQTDGTARLVSLFDMVTATVRDHAPQVAAVEQLFFSTNRQTAMRVAEARGVILMALARSGVAVHEYTPGQVKQAVCGYGGARKPQVMRMTLHLLQLDQSSDDVADACAVAICHHHRARLAALQRRETGRSAALETAVAAARARLGIAAR